MDALNLIFPDGAAASAENSVPGFADLPSQQPVVQRVIGEIVRLLPKGKALRILEIGGGTGGMTSFILPMLPDNCTEYVFTDISLRFIAAAQQKFSRYPFVQYRPLDIELDPTQQRLIANSFDVIIASDVLHATKDLRKTLAKSSSCSGPTARWCFWRVRAGGWASL